MRGLFQCAQKVQRHGFVGKEEVIMSLRLDNQRSIHLTGRAQKFLLTFASFIIPFCGMLLVVIWLGITPFGEHNLAMSDGRGMIGGLISVGKLLRNQGSFLYSLSGMGSNAWAGLAWGGLIPTKAIGLFANQDNALEMLTWFSLINISLCGLSMYLFLSALGEHKASHLIFSTSYAMMGFNVIFFHESGFMIGPQLLPVVMLGLVRLMQGKAPWIYVFALSACIFFNAYFGYMLCVASIIVFLAYLYVEWETVKGRTGKILGTYVASSLIAGFLAASMWVPAIRAYSGGDGRLGKLAIMGVPDKELFPPLRGLVMLFSGSTNGDVVTAPFPNIFCGIFVVGMVVLFFVRKSYHNRRKHAYVVILSIYYLSFIIPYLNIFMHGGSMPNGFFHRFSFLFSFFLILIAADAFQQVETVETYELKWSFFIVVFVASLAFLFIYDFASGIFAVCDIFLLGIMWALVYLGRNRTACVSREMVTLLLCMTVFINLFSNYWICIRNMRKLEMDLEEYRAASIVMGGTVDAVNTVDPAVYRIEEDYLGEPVVGMYAGVFGYRNVSSFSPLIRTTVHRNLSKLGINWENIMQWYSASVPVTTDALLGIKYICTEEDLKVEKNYDRISSIWGISAYRNPNALPFAFLAKEESGSIKLTDNTFENANAIWKGITGEKSDIYTQVDDVQFSLHTNQEWTYSGQELKTLDSSALQGSSVTFTFTAPKDGVAYYYDTGISNTELGEDETTTHCAGICRKGEVITDTLLVPATTDNDSVAAHCGNLVFAVADNAVLADYADKVQAKDITFNIMKGHHLTGEFTAEAGERILFTLPWDEGWTCTIDGERVPIDKTWDLFMSVEAPEGHHTYEMKFFPAWMDYGLVISGIALVGLVVFMILWNKKNKKTAAVSAETTNADGLISDTSENTGADKAETVTDAVAERTIEKDRSEAAE